MANDWATGTNAIVEEPPQSLKVTGFQPSQRPTAGIMNWLFRNLSGSGGSSTIDVVVASAGSEPDYTSLQDAVTAQASVQGIFKKRIIIAQDINLTQSVFIPACHGLHIEALPGVVINCPSSANFDGIVFNATAHYVALINLFFGANWNNVPSGKVCIKLNQASKNPYLERIAFDPGVDQAKRFDDSNNQEYQSNSWF